MSRGEGAWEEWRLCGADEIAEGQVRGFELELDGRSLRIFTARRAGALYTYLNRCPHRGTPLDWRPDEFFDEDGRYLVCGTHGAIFQVEDGLCLAGPCAGDLLTPVETFVSAGELYARIPARD